MSMHLEMMSPAAPFFRPFPQQIFQDNEGGAGNPGLPVGRYPAYFPLNFFP